MACWNYATGGDILEALANSLFHISTCGEVEKALIGGGILDDCLCYSVYRQYERTFCLLQTPEELSRFASEGRYGLDIFGNVDMPFAGFIAPLTVPQSDGFCKAHYFIRPSISLSHS